MSKRKSLAILIAIVLVVVLLGVVSMTGFPISSTKYVMPIYKAIQLGEDSEGGISATYKVKDGGDTGASALDMQKALDTMRRRMDLNGFAAAQVLLVGGDTIKIEYPELGYVNHDPFTEMLAERALLQLIDPEGNVVFDSSDLEAAVVGQHPETELYGVVYQLNSNGIQRLRTSTTKFVGQEYIYYLDGEPMSALLIQDPIVNGQEIITPDGITQQTAEELAMKISGGALPFAMERTDLSYFSGYVPSGSMLQALMLCLIVMAAAILAFVVMYRKNGLTAAISLLVFIFLFVLALATVESVRLSIASFAGVIAAFMMAIATVTIILECDNYELHEGKSVSGALSSGFSRAAHWLADIHVAAAVIGMALFFLGSASLKDFSITLLIGLAFDVFVVFGTMYGCQRLVANLDDNPVSYTRMGKQPRNSGSPNSKKSDRKA